MSPRRFLRAIAAIAGIVFTTGAAFCGPELNAPGRGDITGTWHSDGPAAGLTDIDLDLLQKPDGTVTGTYTATGTPGLQACNAEPCMLASSVEGINSVLQVNLELRDAGTFTGQLEAANEMRGTMTRTLNELIRFTRVPAP